MAPIQKVILGLALFSSCFANAIEFKTDYFSISLPEKWNCDPSNGTIICSDTSIARKKTAVAVINFGPKTESDSLAFFTRIYSVPRINGTNQKAQLRSKVISVDNVEMLGQTFVKSLHFEGELPDYYTYYLGTVTDQHVYLFSFSAHKDDWEELKPVFENSISTIKIFAPIPQKSEPSLDPNIHVDSMTIASPPPEAELPPTTSTVISTAVSPGVQVSKSHMFLFISVVTLGLVGLYALRK